MPWFGVVRLNEMVVGGWRGDVFLHIDPARSDVRGLTQVETTYRESLPPNTECLGPSRCKFRKIFLGNKSSVEVVGSRNTMEEDRVLRRFIT